MCERKKIYTSKWAIVKLEEKNKVKVENFHHEVKEKTSE